MAAEADDVPEGAAVMEEAMLERIGNRRVQPTESLRLHHFEHHTFGAPGEPVRLAFAVAGIEFEDLRVPRLGEEWKQIKHSGQYPFEQLPVLEVGDTVLSQSNTVLRYAGLLAGLYPAHDLIRAAKVDEILGVIQDIKMRMVPSMLEARIEVKNKMRQGLAKEKLPWWFNRLEALLCTNDAVFCSRRGFCVGDKLTIADLALVCFLGWFEHGSFIGIQGDLLKDFPRLRQVIELVLAVPRIYKWRQDHPTKYFHESDWIPALQGLRKVVAEPQPN